MKTTRPSELLKRAALGMCLPALLGTLAVTAQAQLYQWNFNSPSGGTTVAPNVSVGGGGLNMNYGGVATDLYGPLGSGVSGGANDRAFANNNTTYGTAASSGVSVSTPVTGVMGIGSLSQFTMTGWIKADNGFNYAGATAFPRVFMIGPGTPDTGAANAATLAIFNNTSSQTSALQLRLSNIAGPNGTDGALSGTNSLLSFGSDWTFFGVTADLTSASNNVSFYLGNALSLNAPITASYNIAGAPIGSIDFGASASALLLNRNDRGRGFDGLGDDFRFYSGVLNSTLLNGVRLSASPVPEPGTMALLGLGGALGIMALRRRRD